VPQRIITPENDYAALDAWLAGSGVTRLFLVCDPSLAFLKRFSSKLASIGERLPVVRFSDFQPNPLYESVADGVARFRDASCDAILAVGGGSAIDVAKCVKLYANLDPSRNYLEQDIVPNGIPFLAMPTTAGTGSEATRYAVIYHQGAKQSVTHDSIIPSTVLFDPSALETLPPYQRKSTMLDALCHAVESFWSVKSTPESRAFSRDAIRGVLAHLDGYLANTPDGNAGMLRAAYRAGQAINVTQTTAGHAMCYKLTYLFDIAHGHAAALCDRVLFPWMLSHADRCCDPRGEPFLHDVFRQIADAMDCSSPDQAARKFDTLVASLSLSVPAATEAQFAELRCSVNPVRLKNHPVALDLPAIDTLYRKILLSA
jgi:alcohol dehydrogenase class IV